MSKKILLPAAVLLSGICWFFSLDLTGNFWWLLWIAPAPVLYASFQVSNKQAFLIAVIAFLIGKLSWSFQLLSVMPLVLVVVITVFLSLVFALIALLVRKTVLVASKEWAVLAFPVLWTSFEWLLFLFSRDGTAGSIAYTQSNFLPMIQIASITGILGISFLVCFVPSVIAVVGFYRLRKKNTGYLLPAAAAVVLLVILYGSMRMHNRSDRKEVSAGLIVLEERLYTHIYDTLPAHEVHIADLYLQETARLAAEGAQVVLLPEKAIPVTDATDAMITGLFKDAARKLGITIVAGYTRIYKDHLENKALVISSKGELITDYRKVKLFEWEPLQGFTAGRQAGVFDLDSIHAGVAICKDLDYQSYMLTYGRSGISILYVPAWDFVGDGWLHSRMAILRGVENGYPLVRNARQGRLTISDACGRVLYEAISEKGSTTVLLGKIRPAEAGTLYSRWGDWFGYLNLLAACYLIFIAIRKKAYSASSPSTTR